MQHKTSRKKVSGKLAVGKENVWQVVAPLTWGRISFSSSALESLGLYGQQSSRGNRDKPSRRRGDEMTYSILISCWRSHLEIWNLFQLWCSTSRKVWLKIKNQKPPSFERYTSAFSLKFNLRCGKSPLASELLKRCKYVLAAKLGPERTSFHHIRSLWKSA